MYPYLYTYDRFTAVAFQFTCIGNDPGAAQLLIRLKQDPNLGACVDGFLVGSDLERQLADKWFVVCHYQLFSKLADRDPTDLIFASEK